MEGWKNLWLMFCVPPTTHVIDVDSTSQQRRVSSGPGRIQEKAEKTRPVDNVDGKYPE